MLTYFDMITFFKNLKFGTAENLAVRRFALEPANTPDGPDNIKAII